MRTAVLALALLIAASAPAPAQEELLPAGETGVLKRGWVLLNTYRYARGEGEIAVPDGALGDRSVNYVAFYVEGELVAVDEVPPYRVTHDFGSYTRRVRIAAIGVRYELEAGAEPAAQSHEPGVGAPAASIAITSPAQGDYCYGLSRLAAEVEAPPGAVLRVDFAVDGRLAGSVAAPPYELEFDFGRGFEGRLVSATAVLADGRQVGVERRTPPLEGSDYYVRARLVTLDATVVDWRDRLVGDLAADEFRVSEDGREQRISHFSLEDRPLRVALLIDTSGSMSRRGKMSRAIAAAQRFLEFLRPGQDMAAVVAFNDSVAVPGGFSDDFDSLRQLIGELEAGGGTAINDALAAVAPLFEGEVGRKAIILISDGYDEHSGISVGEAVETVKQAGVKVYSIAILEHLLLLEEAIAPPPTRRGVEPPSDPEDPRRTNRPLDGEVDPRKTLFIGLADETGGAAFFPRSLLELPVAFERIAEELRRQYSIGYVSTNTDYDGRWRRLSVRTTRSGLTVRTKRGYYADE